MCEIYMDRYLTYLDKEQDYEEMEEIGFKGDWEAYLIYKAEQLRKEFEDYQLRYAEL